MDKQEILDLRHRIYNDVSLLQENELRIYAIDYIRKNEALAIPCIKEKPLTSVENKQLETVLIHLMTGNFEDDSFLGQLVRGELSAIAKADSLSLRAIKLIFLFEYNESSGIRIKR